MPARPLHSLWSRYDGPPLELFIGAADVVHGTNFVVPPTRRAASVVSIHDLTPLRHPELSEGATLAYPGLIRRALQRDAWVHADSAFVAAEVVDAFEADPDRVRVVYPGVPDLPEVADLEARRSCGASCRRGPVATAWRWGRPSRARTFLVSCTRSAAWPHATPMSP